MANRKIDTPKRQAAFLGQVGHESGQLQYVRELGSGQYLSKYDTCAAAWHCSAMSDCLARLSCSSSRSGRQSQLRGSGR